MLTRAAALAAALALLSLPAFAGTTSRSFMVGAVVVRSATVTASVAATGNGVRVEQISSRGTPAPLVLAGGTSNPMPASGALQLSAAASAQTTVTLLY